MVSKYLNILLVILGLVVFLFGYALGSYTVKQKYQLLITDLEVKALIAEKEFAKSMEDADDKWYEKLQTALDRTPDTVTERVFVKADCPSVRVSETTEVDDGGATQRVELREENTRKLRGVIAEAEAKYAKCYHSLQFFRQVYTDMESTTP